MYDEGNEKEMVNEVSSQVSERKGGGTFVWIPTIVDFIFQHLIYLSSRVHAWMASNVSFWLITVIF